MFALSDNAISECFVAEANGEPSNPQHRRLLMLHKSVKQTAANYLQVRA